MAVASRSRKFCSHIAITNDSAAGPFNAAAERFTATFPDSPSAGTTPGVWSMPALPALKALDQPERPPLSSLTCDWSGRAWLASGSWPPVRTSSNKGRYCRRPHVAAEAAAGAARYRASRLLGRPSSPPTVSCDAATSWSPKGAAR